MRRFSTISLVCLCTLISFAQSKMSAASRGMTTEAPAQVALLAKVNEAFNSDALTHLGISTGARVGNIVTLRTTKNNLPFLETYAGIEYLEMAQRVSPNLMRVIPDLRADSVYTGHGLDAGYTGKDVIIGVTDWGFDYTHPMFYDTALQHTRIIAAWDQFKTSGPAPQGYNYGTVYEGESELLTAQSDTSNIYGFATHGTHVAGIAGGSGAGTAHRGVAYEAEFLFVTFLVDEAAVIDAFEWMKTKAETLNKRLVINMSWGLYNLGPLDGTSLVSLAIDELSQEGVIFVTSGGNNGDITFHIKKEFREDTLRSKIDFWRSSDPNRYGQSIMAWGTDNSPFAASIEVYDAAKNKLTESPTFRTEGSVNKDTFMTIGSDTVFYKVALDGQHPLNAQPTIRFRIRSENNSLHIALKAHAATGTVHFYNVADLTTHVGNWGMPFTAWKDGWAEGDNKYSLGEPASTRSVITVAAHQSEVRTSGGTVGGGFLANFSSYGPTIDERMKPDVSAPGVSVASSVSSFTNRNYDLLQNISFQGKNYPFSRFSGTSMSSPATAGVVALMLQANPNLWYDEAIRILHNTAREDNRTGDLSEKGDTQWGWGKVNALAATQAAEYKFAGIRNLIEPSSSLYLFPNPAQNTLRLNSTSTHEVYIYSSTGQVILNGSLGNSLPLDVSTLTNGIYLLRFADSHSVSIPFMIHR
jgi:minor extracellular serine protease Vpr